MKTNNFNQFIKDTQKQIDIETKKLKQKAVTVILFAHKKLVEGTPVKDGLLRNNHIITYNSTTSRVIDKKDKNNNPTDDQIPEVVKMKFNNGDKIIIQNNLSYMPKIEALGGKDKNAYPPLLYKRSEAKTEKFIKDLKWD